MKRSKDRVLSEPLSVRKERSMKKRRTSRFVLLCTVLFLFVFSVQTMAKSFVMEPEVLYTGETAVLKVVPEGKWFLPAGASTINRLNKKYFKMLRGNNGHFVAIKALKTDGGYTKIIKGAIQPGNIMAAFIFRSKVPYFKGTYRGKEFKVDDIHTISVGEELKFELVCNNQADVKWTVSPSGNAQIVSQNKNTVTLKGAETGRATVTAQYLGRKYSVVFNVRNLFFSADRFKDVFNWF